MSKYFLKIGFSLLAVASLTGPLQAATAADKKLSGHVPAVTANLAATGRLAATNQLNLVIGLSLRNQGALTNLLQQISNPDSHYFRRYLTPEEFTAQFGPTPQDYQAAVDFATANGLAVTATHGNRMLLEVRGSAAAVENAFKVKLQKYRHPKEDRDFFAPDTEPTVPASLAVLDIGGLSSYARPYSKLRKKPAAAVVPKAGSGPGGNYIGYDFRAAYVPGTALDGTGQKVALVQFDGYLASDMALYAQLAGLPGVPPLTNILLNGFSGFPTGTGGEVEVSLDIQMVMSMAPNLSQILVYEGDPFNFNPNVVLNRIATDNMARQVGCSWGWIGGPNATSEQIFQQMALQGQSFFNASGDSDAFLPGQVDDPNDFGFPSCSPNITQVGGTTLTTTGPVGARVSETVWNWGGGVGSCGGISDFYATPTWQLGFGTVTNHGSSTGRNIPDVALTADGVYVIADNGTPYPGTGGTSCAAPLWAGYMALVNQQAVANGAAPAGFINPTIYALAKTPAYNTVFNDITTGDNTWSRSPTNFPAVPGYDLCTGLGTPTVALISALATGTSGVVVVTPPSAPYGTNLAVLNGGNPNGNWYLFVQDDAPLDFGSISNGWILYLTTANPVGAAADVAVSLTASASSVIVNSNLVFIVGVTNYGPSAAGNVLVADVLPYGVTLLNSNLTQGTLTSGSQLLGSGTPLNWNVGNLAANAGAQLTLTVRPTLVGNILTAATVSTGTTDPNPDDDSAEIGVNVVAYAPPPQLTGISIPGPRLIQFSVTNGTGSVIIQGSTNLVNWVNLYTNVQPFTFTTSTTNPPVRFYRAVVGP